MPHKSTDVPRSKSEAGAADWYQTAEGRRQTQREFARALKEGTLIRSAGSKITRTDQKAIEALVEQAKRNATRPISIRVPIADLERAQRIAAATGVGYQTVLKKAIRQGLKRAG